MFFAYFTIYFLEILHTIISNPRLPYHEIMASILQVLACNTIQGLRRTSFCIYL